MQMPTIQLSSTEKQPRHERLTKASPNFVPSPMAIASIIKKIAPRQLFRNKRPFFEMLTGSCASICRCTKRSTTAKVMFNSSQNRPIALPSRRPFMSSISKRPTPQRIATREPTVASEILLPVRCTTVSMNRVTSGATLRQTTTADNEFVWKASMDVTSIAANNGGTALHHRTTSFLVPNSKSLRMNTSSVTSQNNICTATSVITSGSAATASLLHIAMPAEQAM
mmetsp:Transcript_114418/g.323457  ORF Transcript_114418/g.323457 Transcript_114418/m.323457 type:complete len:225 (+) Transcript_114418:418-1092(+)